MMRKHKWKMIVSSAVILLPVVAGLIFWKRLPEMMTTHWGADGVADGQSGKSFAVFFPYGILLAAHWLCLLLTLLDRGNRTQTTKAMNIVFWIIPAISLFCGGMIYGTAFGRQWDYIALMPTILGSVLLLLGNYMPKIRQNRTLGVKLPWTLNNEENWNKTHRFCGWVWVAGGAAMIFSVLLPENAIIPVVVVAIIILTIAPMIYSYCLYRRQQAQGKIQEKSYPKMKFSVAAAVAAGIILAGAAFLMFSGNVLVTFEETALTVDSAYWRELTVEYDAVDSVEYYEQLATGMRTYGFGSARLSLGNFHSKELGDHVRYTYGSCPVCIVIKAGENTLVINGADKEATKVLYKELIQRIG